QAPYDDLYPWDQRWLADGTLLGRFAPGAGLVAGRQTVAHRRQEARSRGPSADAITAAFAPTGRAPAVFGDGLRCLVGARYAVAAARHPARGAPLAGLSRLR